MCTFSVINLYLAAAGQIRYLSLPADPPVTQPPRKVGGGFPRKATIRQTWRHYGLLAMGNGHAPGTEIGLSAAGVETTATGFGAGLPGDAGLAVFFFAAFLIAGFLAGFFLAGFVLTGFFFAGFVLAAFFLAGFVLAAFFLASLLLAGFFLGIGFFLIADFFDAVFLAALRADFFLPVLRFAVAIGRTSVC
jgi:hypothetical protein